MTTVSIPYSPPSAPAITNPPRLLERFREAARAHGNSAPTTDALAAWARSYILFHNKRHPSELGLPQVTHFLEHIVKTAKEPLTVLAQARAALSLLYDTLLGIHLGELPQRAFGRARLSTACSRQTGLPPPAGSSRPLHTESGFCRTRPIDRALIVASRQ